MKILYFTRKFGAHDSRWVRGLSMRAEVSAVSLHDTIPPKVHTYLGSLLDGSADELCWAELSTRFRTMCARFEPDLVVAGPLSDCGFIVANANIGCPWVAVSWAFDVFWESAHDVAAGERVRQSLLGCDGLLVDCDAVIRRCANLIGATPLRTYSMPWGLDPSEFVRPWSRSGVRSELGWTDLKVLLCPRGFDEVYAPLDVIEAWRKLRPMRDRCRLVMAGDGALRSKAEAIVRAFGLCESVSFIGKMNHSRMLQLYEAADLYISCARSDGTSISLLEAMACELPPIVTDVGGNREWIPSSKNGWVVASGAITEITAAIEEGFSLNPARREVMIRANRECVATKADWNSNVEGLNAFLASLVQ